MRMQGKRVRRGQRGAAAVEYGVIVGLVSMAVTASVGLLGGNLSDAFCNTARSLGSDASCVQGSSTAAEGSGSGSGAAAGAGNAAGSGSAAGAGAGAGSGAVATGDDDSTAAGNGGTENPGSGTDPGTSNGSTDQTATNSAGTLTFYSAVVDQDQRKRDLSARFNLGWFPNSWADVQYPESLTVDVSWSPALEVDQVITGNSGSWDYTLVSPGHLRLTHTGAVTTSGFNPQPEILLTKSDTTEKVTVTFSAEAPNTPPVSATSSTTSVPYK